MNNLILESNAITKAFTIVAKGQVILKEHVDASKSTKKNPEILVRISALASKKR